MEKQLPDICQQIICDDISMALYCVVMATFCFGGLYLEKLAVKLILLVHFEAP